jgi:glycosyltransferase involved in cell wall biosynthesis
MLRVMFVGHTAKASGGEIALARLLAALRDSIEPLVVLGEDGPLVEQLTEMGVEVVVLPLSDDTRDLRKERLANPLVALSRATAVFSYARRLSRVIRERRIDLVHTNSLKAGFYGCLAARLARVPSIWHVRDRLADDYLPRAAVLAARAGTATLPTRVLVNSEATRATVPGRRRPVVVPDPIDADEVTPTARTGERSSLRIAMVGRFSPWKGQVVAVQAFAAAQLPESTRLVLIGAAMFGEQDYEQLIHAEISRLGLEGRVELTGFVDDVLGALRDVDVLVHASTIPEPFGQVVLEGLAVGLPVVATREGGPGEILTDRVDGLLYDAGDVPALAARLGELADDEELRSRLAENGRKRVADFSPETVAAAVLEVYQGLAGRRAGTGER